MKNEIEDRGFKIVPQAIEGREQQELILMLGPVSGAGRRGLLDLPTVAAFAVTTIAQPGSPTSASRTISRPRDLFRKVFGGKLAGSVASGFDDFGSRTSRSAWLRSVERQGRRSSRPTASRTSTANAYSQVASR